jgi:hypothetical protein
MQRDQPQTITAHEVMADLHAKGSELEQLAAQLADTMEKLDPIEDEYTAFMDAHEIGLWTKHTDSDCKLPAAALRVKLAHRDMDPVLYGRYFALVKSRERLVKRIATLKVSVEASRSLLSAMKEGLV